MPVDGISYRMYEEYYARAREADRAGRSVEAKILYLSASESLYRTAKAADGQVRDMLLRRAERLEALADALPAGAPTSAATPQKPPSGAARDLRPSHPATRDAEDPNAVFLPSPPPNVHFEDIAGLKDVKDAVNTRIILPRRHPEVFKAFNRPLNGGILLYGPPGTGKTMIAKAIATEIDAAFYAIRCSDIVGKYFGEAEKNIKALFDAARSQDSAILFFDEFEALAAKRGGHSTVMNRLVPELLSQIDGFTTDREKSLLLLAATNRPWDLDTAFLRPPRLTEKIYVGLPDSEARLYLIRRNLQNVPCAADFTFEEVAALTEGFNGADVAEFCEGMKDTAIKRTLSEYDAKEFSAICRADMLAAAGRVYSSVQQSDIQAILRWEEGQGRR